MSVKTVPAIEVQNISLHYSGNSILDSVSFTVSAGQYIGIVGPNGGGKTTLLKILLGLLAPNTGTVRIFGETPMNARKKGKIGYVPQRVSQGDIVFPLSVREMVTSGRTPSIGIGHPPKKEDREAVERAMNMVEIAHVQGRLVATLSGGERQRVFIARALAAEPKLLILDEPTTGVDLSAKEEFYTLLKKLNRELGLTIVFVSHDIEVMTREVTEVLALNQKLLCHCQSHEFLSQETIQKLYGSSIHTHSHSHHHE